MQSLAREHPWSDLPPLAIAYLVGALLPFTLRLLQALVPTPILGRLFRPCCGRVDGTDVVASAFINPSKNNAGPTVREMWETDGSGESWEKARRALGWSHRAAVTVAAIRLLAWHWLQPAFYWATLYTYRDEIDSDQLILGLIVAGREAVYWVLTIVAAFRNPVYLIVDLRASLKNSLGGDRSTASGEWYHTRFALLTVGGYVFAPEKVVMGAIFRTYGFDNLKLLLTSINCALDLCGIAALVVGAVKGTLPPALAVGYSLTSLGALCLIGWTIHMQFVHMCGETVWQVCGCDVGPAGDSAGYGPRGTCCRCCCGGGVPATAGDTSDRLRISDDPEWRGSLYGTLGSGTGSSSDAEGSGSSPSMSGGRHGRRLTVGVTVRESGYADRSGSPEWSGLGVHAEADDSDGLGGPPPKM